MPSKNKIAFIIVRGGLGNQIFFYIFSKFLEEKGFIVKFLWYEYLFTKHHNGIELDKVFKDLNEDLKYNYFLKLGKFLRYNFLRKLIGKIIKFRYLTYRKVYQENPHEYIEIFDLNSCKIIFDGFWQNPKYLNREFLSFFKFKIPDNYNNNKTTLKILNSNSISVHIRRGDYLSKEFSDLNVIKSRQYFLKGIDILRNKIENPKFFIFSDDLIWVKENIKGKDIEIVEENFGENSYLDLYLMSLCKNNIISNSTFSYWGAILNTNYNKIIICPEKWSKNIISKDYFPKNWIYLKV